MRVGGNKKSKIVQKIMNFLKSNKKIDYVPKKVFNITSK